MHLPTHMINPALCAWHCALFSCSSQEICAALSRCNTAEAADRKFAIKTLWRVGGRAGEPAFLSLEGLEWNTRFGTVVAEAPQSKPSKLKLTAFVAGASRHFDWLLDFADALIWDRGFRKFDPNVKTWLHDDL